MISTRPFHGRCSSAPVTQVQLSRAGLSSPLVPSPSPHGTPGEEGARAAPLVRGLMLQLGETLSVWSRLAAAGAVAAGGGAGGRSDSFPPGFATEESLTSGEEAFALSSAHVGLLRALLAREGWSAPLADCLREVGGGGGGGAGEEWFVVCACGHRFFIVRSVDLPARSRWCFVPCS